MDRDIDSVTRPDTVVDQLLEESWESRQRRGSQRELTVEAAAAVLFTAVAATLLVLSGAVSAVRPGTACLLIATYAIVARIEFPVGAGHVVPTQLVLVPMLVLLPPGAVPVAVAAGLVLSALPDWARGRVAGRRVLSAVPDAWHAVGPAAVLLAAGSPHIGGGQIPLVAAALAACALVDLASSLTRLWLAGIVLDWRVQLRVITAVWVVDACLAPLGFLAAVSARHHQTAMLVVLPLALLLWLLARDRSKRIDQAYGRLKLVEHERARLRTALGRLGDAFAAKLELEGLLGILLHGSLDAIDAFSGRLTLTGLGGWSDLRIGEAAGVELLEESSEVTEAPGGRTTFGDDEVWMISIPMQIPGSKEVTGALSFARRTRPFEAEDVDTVTELVAKAQVAAGEILGHHELREQVLTDALTGLGNRRRLMTDLSQTFERAAAGDRAMLLLFDLDGFKNYNDTFGHLAGDALLARLGIKLMEAVAPSGAAYRLGGDEFCARIDLDGGIPDELIARASAALCEAGSGFAVRGSLGVVLVPDEADTPERAIQLADERMYANKRGRGRGARTQGKDILLQTMQAMEPELDAQAGLVGELTTRVSRRLGLIGDEIEQVARAAQLHCVGKVGIPDAILNKPGPLSRHEWEFMRQHTIVGERLLSTSPSLRPVAILVRGSHERWDGNGYPDGRAGDSIPLGSRIVAVCDAYGAMISERPYRAALSHREACRELQAGAGTQFDPAVVEAFLYEVEVAAQERLRDPVHDAAEHVRALLRSAQAERTDARGFQTSISGPRRMPEEVVKAPAPWVG
jgi:diguanylate cyclase (GGDEF)-like protein